MVVFDPNPPVTSPSASERIETQLSNSPMTPTQRKRTIEVDPSLYTPSKRMRSLYAALGATSSGSFLVSDNPMPSSTPIIPPVLEVPSSSLATPDWSLITKEPIKMSAGQETLYLENQALRHSLLQAKAQVHSRDLVIEGAHSQLLFQNLHLQKTTHALYKKENRKKNDQALLFEGTAQVLSSNEFYTKILEQNAARDLAAATKAKNAELRTAKKDALARIEEEWTMIKAIHENNVKAWELECQKLASEGLPRRQWPKKPVRPLKPKLSSTLEGVDGVEEDIIEEDGDEDD